MSMESVFFDKNIVIVNSIRPALRDIGFDNVHCIRNQDQLREDFPKADLVIFDIDGGSSFSLNKMKMIRQIKSRMNPFIVSIALTNNKSVDFINSALVVGFDMVLTKPISAKIIIDRVITLTMKRKPFIVTSDYIGPERRRDPSRVSEIPYFKVPNTLNLRGGKNKKSDEEIISIINKQKEEIMNEKIRRIIFQMAFINKIYNESKIKRATIDDIKHTEKHLENTRSLVEEAYFYSRATGRSEIYNYCTFFSEKLSNNVEKKEENTLKDILSSSVQMLLRKVYPELSELEINRQLQSSVDSFRKRTERQKS